MNKLLCITRVMLKGSLSSVKNNKRKVKIPPVVGMLIIMILFITSFSIPIGAFTSFLYDGLVASNQQGVILTIAMAAVSVTIFIFGIIYVLTIFYFSKDVEFFLPLPLKPFHILGGKFITALIYEYLTEAILLLPVVIIYGIKSEASILYYLYGFIIFALLPIIPLVLASIINIIIMRFTNIGKHKDALRILGGMLAIGVGMSINLYTQRINSTAGSQADIAQMLAGENSLVNIVSKVFPSVKPASLALIYNNQSYGIINLLLFIVLTAILLILFFVLGEKMYFKGVLGVSEVYSKRKKLSGEALEKGTKQNSQILSYAFKELRILFRTPSYIINCVITNFMWPFIFIIVMLNSNSSSASNLQIVKAIMENKSVLGIIIGCMFAAGLIIGGGNGIAATSISREGQTIFVNKYIPMSYENQIIAKLVSAMVLNFAAILLILAICSFILKPTVIIILLSLILSLLAALIISIIGILLDLKFPKLHWDNEQKAVKQNFNFVITTLLSFALAAISVISVIIFKLSLWATFLFMASISSIVIFLLYYTISTKGIEWFSKIDV